MHTERLTLNRSRSAWRSNVTSFLPSAPVYTLIYHPSARPITPVPDFVIDVVRYIALTTLVRQCPMRLEPILELHQKRGGSDDIEYTLRRTARSCIQQNATKAFAANGQQLECVHGAEYMTFCTKGMEAVPQEAIWALCRI